MTQFLKDTPPVLWTVLIVGSLALADWLQTYFGGVAWVLPIVGGITMLVVPLLRILGQGGELAGRAIGEPTVERSKLSRWLY